MIDEISKRIAYVVKRYPRFSETFIVNEIVAHEAAGMSIDIFSLLPPNDTHFQNMISQVKAPVYYLPAESPKSVEMWKSFQEAGSILPQFWPQLSRTQDLDARELHQAIFLACQIKKRNIGHIHAHFATAATTVARAASIFSNVPYTFTAHAKDIFHEYVEREDLTRKLSDAMGVITISQYNLQHLKDQFGSAADRVNLIHNGLDLERFPFHSSQIRPPEILGVGRLVEKKGFSDLLKACAILADRQVKFHCSIIGTGELEEELSLQIRDLGLQGRADLIGPIPQANLVEHLQRAAVLAAPCTIGVDGNRDGLPTVLLEAMAVGTCCVATDLTGIPEVVQDGITGILVHQNNPRSLADALQTVLSDPQLRVKLAKNARNMIENKFDIRVNARKIRNFFGLSWNATQKSLQDQSLESTVEI